jgi:hypothetical protein
MASPLLVDLQAYWNLNNNGSGGVSLLDATGNGNDFTAQGTGTTLGAGIIDWCANFDGSGFFESNPTFSASSALTYAGWIKSTNIGETGVWGQIGYGNVGTGYRLLGIGGDIFFQAPHGATVNTTEGTYNDGAWHYVVGIFDGTNFSLYVDNVLIGSATGSTRPSSIPFFLNFSGDIGALGACSIDEVGAWTRALSPTEVNALWHKGRGLTYPFEFILYYNNAENDGDWGNLLNWWKDSGFTVQADALPTNDNPVNLYNQVTQNTQGANQCFCASASFWSANFGAGLTLQSTGIVNMQGSSVMAGFSTNGVSMHDSSTLTATSVIGGNVTMRDASRAFGSIHGNATIYYDGGDGQFPIGGTVAGSVSYIGWPASSPQWYNDLISVGGAGNGDWSDLANWWADDTYTTRPNPALPDASTDVYIGNGITNTIAVRKNTGTPNPTVNSITANYGGIGDASFPPMSFTVTNGIILNNGSYIVDLTIYGNVTFNTSSYAFNSVINGNATYTSAASLQYTWIASANSLGNLNDGATYGSTGFFVNISGGGSGGTALGTNWISRLLHLPWFINV